MTQDATITIEVFKDGQSVFKGPWDQAPAPVAEYIGHAAKHYSGELRDYLVSKPDPLALLYKGYSYRVI